MVKSIVFDLDGTLIDSAPQIAADVNDMLESFGLNILPLDQITSFIGNGVPTLVQRSLAASDADGKISHDHAFARLMEIYRKASTEFVTVFDGVASTLLKLQAHHIAMGICTNRPQLETQALIARLELDQFFNSIVGGNRLPVSKPDPAPLKLCFDELGAGSENRLFVGDSETDEATAQNFGCPFALFTKGYRKKPAEDFTSVFQFDDYVQLNIASLRKVL